VHFTGCVFSGFHLATEMSASHFIINQHQTMNRQVYVLIYSILYLSKYIVKEVQWLQKYKSIFNEETIT